MKKSLNEHNLVIEKYSKNNELQVKQLIDLYNEESYVFHLLRDNKTKCAYVAYYKKDVVGIFFTWGSNFHPYCTYFRIYTNPFYSELHIEKFLLNEISKKRKLQTTITNLYMGNISSFKSVFLKNIILRKSEEHICRY